MYSQEDALKYFGLWSLVWIVCLCLPPGSKAIPSAYRLNFTHGLLSTVMASLCLAGHVPVEMTTPCTLSYFVVDFVNILLNDFVFKVPSYQSPQNRKVEYVHHILCFFVGATAELSHSSLCTFAINPFVQLMFAEFSTPFLIAWRYFGGDLLGGLFVLSFIGCRIIFHGLMFIPDCVASCIPAVGYGFAIPYNLMNIYFLYMIFAKVFKKPKTKASDDSKETKKNS